MARQHLDRLTALDAGRETLDEYVSTIWAPTYAVTLAPKTQLHYAGFYDHPSRPTSAA